MWDEVQVRLYGDATIATGRQSPTGTVISPQTRQSQDITARARSGTWSS